MVSWLWGCEWKGIRWLESGYSWKEKPQNWLVHWVQGGRERRVKTDLIVFGLNNWKDEIAIYWSGDDGGGDAKWRT